VNEKTNKINQKGIAFPNRKGIAFSVEFSIALMLTVIILAFAPQIKETSFETVLTGSQIKDLLTVWAKEKQTNSNEMLSDAEFILGKRKIIIELNEKITENELIETNTVSSQEINYYDSKHNKIKVKITVFQ
jgi:hypothetical protein